LIAFGLGISAVAYEYLFADELEVVNHIVVCLATVPEKYLVGNDRRNKQSVRLKY